MTTSMRKAIMKNAWTLYKRAGCSSRAEFAVALKMSWEMVMAAYNELKTYEAAVEALGVNRQYRVHYSEYKEIQRRIASGKDCKVYDTYDAETKTVVVYLSGELIKAFINIGFAPSKWEAIK